MGCLACAGALLRCRCLPRGVLGGAGEYQDVGDGPAAPASAWRAKWDGFLRTMRLTRRPQFDVDSTRYVFSLMLRLYAHLPVLHELEALYATQPERFVLYVPQFVAFALHGATDSTLAALAAFLHDKSEKSLRFAHRLFWFVRAFSPADLRSGLVVEAEARAAAACKALRGAASITAAPGINPAAVSGEPAELALADAGTGPVRPLPRLAAGPPHVIGVSDFRWSVAFFDELTNMGGTLKDVPEPDRNSKLRATLQSLVEDFLPSDVLYLPVGRSPARVVNVLAHESFCFKTNTRVPFMVILEVVDDFGGDGSGAAEGADRDSMGPDSMRGRLQETLGELGSQLRRQFSGGPATTPARGRLDPMLRPNSSLSMLRSESNVSLEPMLGGGAVDLGRSRENSHGEAGAPEEPLGQWAPVQTPARGAGFSHFDFHQGYEFERKRSSARLKVLAQQHSVPSLSALEDGFTEVELAPSTPAYSKRSGRLGRADSDTSLSSARSPSLERRHSSFLSSSDDDDDLHSIDLDMSEVMARVAVNGHLPVRGLDTEDAAQVHLDSSNAIGSKASAASPARNAAANERCEPGADNPGDDDDSSCQGVANGGEAEDKQERGVIFRERWRAKQARIAATSKYSKLPGWHLLPIIVKSGDDLRQEQFAAQMIKLFHTVFQEEGLRLWLHPYDVLATTPDAGVIQAVPDTISLDSLKKNDPHYVSLRDFFIRYFGRPNSKGFKRAQMNFCESLAAYCIVCYFLQIKDRHNGNLLLTADGHIVHIDFGFILSSQGPGNMNFERYPFKLTTEFVQLLGGPDSSIFRTFRSLCCKAFLAARKHREQFVLMIEMMLSGESAHLPCFQAGGEETIRQFNERFCMDKSRSGCISYVNDLIDTSIGNWRSKWYDIYQRFAVGIAV